MVQHEHSNAKAWLFVDFPSNFPPQAFHGAVASAHASFYCKHAWQYPTFRILLKLFSLKANLFLKALLKSFKKKDIFLHLMSLIIYIKLFVQVFLYFINIFTNHLISKYFTSLKKSEQHLRYSLHCLMAFKQSVGKGFGFSKKTLIT